MGEELFVTVTGLSRDIAEIVIFTLVEAGRIVKEKDENFPKRRGYEEQTQEAIKKLTAEIEIGKNPLYPLAGDISFSDNKWPNIDIKKCVTGTEGKYSVTMEIWGGHNDDQQTLKTILETETNKQYARLQSTTPHQPNQTPTLCKP